MLQTSKLLLHREKSFYYKVFLETYITSFSNKVIKTKLVFLPNVTEEFLCESKDRNACRVLVHQ